MVDIQLGHRGTALATRQTRAGHDIYVLSNERAKADWPASSLLVHLLASLNDASANVLGCLHRLCQALTPRLKGGHEGRGRSLQRVLRERRDATLNHSTNALNLLAKAFANAIVQVFQIRSKRWLWCLLNRRGRIDARNAVIKHRTAASQATVVLPDGIRCLLCSLHVTAAMSGNQLLLKLLAG